MVLIKKYSELCELAFSAVEISRLRCNVSFLPRTAVIEIRVTTSYAEISPALAGLCALGYEDFMAGNEQNTRVRLRIRGRVQGVAFRAYATEEALRRGVKGWVRNCPDGSVELVAEGNRREVDELVAWCRQGPPSARVDHMDVQPEDFKAKFRDFRVKG